MENSKDHKAAAEPPLDCRVSHEQERVLRKAAVARAAAYSREITRLEAEVEHYQKLYVEQRKELHQLRAEAYVRLGSTGG